MQKIPDSELEIMMIIWEANTDVTSEYIMEKLNKTWVKCTVLKFLTRLCERGFLSFTKDGRQNVYHAKVQKDDYLQTESKNIFEKLYQSSLKNLISCLYDGKSITKKDLDELKKYIEEAK